METLISSKQVAQFLDAARETISTVRYCWVATHAHEGGANARAVRVWAGKSGEDEWTRRFIARRTSRKIGEIRSDPKVTLAYQADGGNAYVALGGSAMLIDDPPQIAELWPEGVKTGSAAGSVEAGMLVVSINVDRIEVHVKGVTAEPFGHGRTLLDRISQDEWRFVPD